MSAPRKRITIDAPSEAVILAARHLDATEGPVQVGATVDASTRSAITTVLRYISEAHNSPAVDVPVAEGFEELKARWKAIHAKTEPKGDAL